MHTWDREHPEDTYQPPEETKTEGELPQPEAEHKPEEGIDPEKAKQDLEQEKPWADPVDAATTPEMVSQWGKDNPLLDQAWNANPALKNQMHAMARKNAKLEPLGQIFPNEKSAKFAAETSGNWVKVESAFSNAADNPGTIGDAVDLLAEQFMIRDDKGNPVLDASGAHTFQPEWEHTNRFFLDNGLDTMLDGIEASKGPKGELQFKSDDDEILHNAITYVKSHLQNRGKAKTPAMDNLTPEQREWQTRMNAEFEERAKQLGIDTQKQKLEGKSQARDLHESQVSADIAGVVGRRLDQIMKDKKAAGIYIPSYVLNMKDPATGISAFAKGCLDDFMKEIGAVSYYDGNFKALQRKAPNEATRKERVDLATEALDEFLPRVIEGRLRAAQTSDKADQVERRQGRQQAEARGEGAVREPQGGSAPSAGSGPGNDAQQYQKAREFVAKNFPDIDPKDRLSKTLQVLHSNAYR